MDYQAFKYRSLNENFYRTIKASEIWFAPPRTLNDPFDCNVAVMKAVRIAMERCNGAKKVDLLRLLNAGTLHGVRDIFEHMNSNGVTKLGIFSLSHETENPLLWAHYSDNHEGVCLIYQFNKSFVWSQENKVLAFPYVNYSMEPLIDFFMHGFFETTKIRDLLFEVLKIVITLKSPEWSYEREVRMVRNGSGAVTIPKSFLSGVIFGVRVGQKKKEELIDYFGDNGYKTQFFDAIENPSEFGIAVSEYDA